MIICSSCGVPIPNNAKFCKDCGTAVPENVKFCASCHSDIPEGSKFCTDCGTRLEEDNSKSVSAMLIILIVIGAGFVFYRSLDLPKGNLMNKNNVSVNSNAINKYEEESFHTLIFKGQTTHQAKLNVITPTTQALILENVKDWISNKEKAGKIKQGDISEIDVFEKDLNSGKATDRAKMIYVDLNLNPDYEFKDYTYSNFGNNLNVYWKTN